MYKYQILLICLFLGTEIFLSDMKEGGQNIYQRKISNADDTAELDILLLFLYSSSFISEKFLWLPFMHQFI